MDVSIMVDAMVIAGCSAEQIAAVVKACSAAGRVAIEEKRERNRASNAERQRRYRNAHNGVTQRDNALPAVTQRDEIPSPCPSPQRDNSNPPSPSAPDLTAPERVNGSGQKRATRLTSESEPTTAMAEYARSKGLSGPQVQTEFARMRDWSLSNKAGAKLDWEATWRNWVRDIRPNVRAPPVPSGRHPTRIDTLAEIQRNSHQAMIDERAFDANPTLDLSVTADPRGR